MPPRADQLEALGLLYRERPVRVARVERGRRLEEKDVNFVLGNGPMLRAAWHDDELALVHGDRAVPELHVERALDDEEELIFGFVLMPDERALELDELDVLAIQLADDLGVPVGGEEGEFFCEVDRVHGRLDSGTWRRMTAGGGLGYAAIIGARRCQRRVSSAPERFRMVSTNRIARGRQGGGDEKPTDRRLRADLGDA
jgi:hypothetical protein